MVSVQVTGNALGRARGGDEHAFRELVEPYRRELQLHCYRILGSLQDAEDQVQETLLAAWRGLDGFEERASLRAWLYRIATNRCLNALRDRSRRPQEVSRMVEPPKPTRMADPSWLEPYPDVLLEGLADVAPGPDARYETRETVGLAFVAALQQLPARQRAVLILCEVLRWPATEVAELLDTSVASVNSALQRARATLAARETSSRLEPIDAEQKELLAKYVDAFERYDIASLVSLLHHDAVMSMPPYPFWLQGPTEMGEWFLGEGIVCQGGRLLATAANGGAAFGNYHVDPSGGFSPWAIQVIEISDGRIIGHHNFLDTALFEAFGLPAHLDA